MLFRIKMYLTPSLFMKTVYIRKQEENKSPPVDL